ncbi:MAG: VapC toxin family PIN domain ribonuclease [Acidobacteria bacterium]|nr:MAG: VapC toxin family PIN domain ribonuclease [Acidobacteriota bacterium]
MAKCLRSGATRRCCCSRSNRGARSGNDRSRRLAMILDTNAISALLSGNGGLETVLDEESVHHLPVIAIGEYRYGLARSKYGQRLERLLDLLIQESVVLPIDESTTRHYARLREQLRRAGTPIPENDVWIAALAQQHDLPIISRDSHFDTVDPRIRRAW